MRSEAMLLHPLLRRSPRSLRRPVGRILLLLSAVLGFVLFFLLEIPAAAFLELSPVGAVFWLLGLTSAFLVVFARPRGRRAAVRRRHSRLRSPGSAIPWLLWAIPLSALASFALGIATARTMDLAALDRPGTLSRYEARSLGWLPVALVAGLYGPLLEEFGFRSWMQRPLERAFGAPSGIVLTSVVFGLLHDGPAANRVFGGLALGAAVVITGSIWSAVLLHVGTNLLAMVIDSLLPDDLATTAEAVRWLAGAVGDPVLFGTPVVCSILLVLIGMKLWRLRRPGSSEAG